MRSIVLHKRPCPLVVVALVLAGFAAPPVHANGYKVLCVKSAKATAMGEAFIVAPDDPSAIAYNPAGLAQLRGNQVNVHGILVNGYAEHTGSTGRTTHNVDQWQGVPSLYATTDFDRQHLAVGLGLSLPNGLSSEWSHDSFARYVATYSSLMVADICPAIGVQLTEHLMVGAGLDFYYSKARLDHMIDMGLFAGTPGAMDVEASLRGSGTTWGFNVGLVYQLNRRHALAATYRQPYSIRFDGDLAVGGVSQDLSTKIDFPAVTVIGYAFRPNPRWTMQVNLDWTDWQAVDDITLRFKDLATADVVQEQGFTNTMAWKVGSEYAWSDRLALRCGYIHNQSATPERNWRPSLIDTRTQFITLGTGSNWKRLTIDTALHVVFYRDRTIDNNVDNNESISSSSIDGTYQAFTPGGSLAVTYRY